MPVGAFLSGGIDSSTVVALYQEHSPGRVKTFTIGFEEAGFNEAVYAKEVARHLGTEHHERYVTFPRRGARDSRPAEPCTTNRSPIRLRFLLIWLAYWRATQVTVALSGDGGDELFGGYNRYLAAARFWAHLKRLPRPVRAAVGRQHGAYSAFGWNGLAALLPSGRRPAFFGTKVQKLFGNDQPCFEPR